MVTHLAPLQAQVVASGVAQMALGLTPPCRLLGKDSKALDNPLGHKGTATRARAPMDSRHSKGMGSKGSSRVAMGTRSSSPSRATVAMALRVGKDRRGRGQGTMGRSRTRRWPPCMGAGKQMAISKAMEVNTNVRCMHARTQVLLYCVALGPLVVVTEVPSTPASRRPARRTPYCHRLGIGCPVPGTYASCTDGQDAL